MRLSAVTHLRLLDLQPANKLGDFTMEQHDHRVLGESLDLFHFSDQAPGVVFWHPRGYALYQAVESYMRRRVMGSGYAEVRSPMMMARSIWQDSGHWDLYGQNMFLLERDRQRPAVAIKPMNCPGHIEIFKNRVRSWRDLPIRFAEFGQCHRNEPSGSLHGLLRLRGFVQDDGHIFCRPDQVEHEVAKFCQLLRSVYADFGFQEFGVAMSLRPSLRAGSDDQWNQAEAMLAAAAASAGLDPEPMPGEGAFYGPKLEFSLQDRLGRSWQCGTLQLDLILPGRLGVHYRDSDDGRPAPVLLHRAVLGSLERFIGIMLEHHAGALPAWLAPEQVAVVPVADRHNDYARQAAVALQDVGIRAIVMDGGDRMSAKIRDASNLEIPIMAVVGDKEITENSLALRMSGSQESLDMSSAIDRVKQACLAP